MPDLIRTVEDNIFCRNLLQDGESLIVAVSGGVDSMVLLNILCSLSKSYRWKIHVAHLNHNLRGKESDADEMLVRQTARKHKVPISVERADISRVARVKSISIEMAARVERHAFLARTALNVKAGKVVLAHHADDQVELFFLRLFRGSGAEGFGGMKWKGKSPAAKGAQDHETEDSGSGNDVILVRPLLNVRKAELLAYAKEHKVQYREDATNQSLDIKRNRIRHELLPMIRKHYQGAIDNVVLRASEILAAESEYVVAAAREWVRIRKPLFPELPEGLQRQVLRLQLIEIGISPEYELIEKLRLRADAKVSASVSGKPGWVSRDTTGTLYARDGNRSVSYSSTRLETGVAPNGVCFFRGLRIRWTTSKARSRRLPKFGPGREWFDAEKVGGTVTLRHWAPGDRFQPIGMKKAVKLQDIFVNQKIPRHERPELVLATTASGEIFWVEKLRISERFKLSSRTKSRLKWHWQRG